MGAIEEVEIACQVKRETALAYLVDTGDGQHWLPKSQIKDYCADKNGVISSVFIPDWLANEKGLI